MNTIAWLEFELAYFEVAVQQFSHYVMRTLPSFNLWPLDFQSVFTPLQYQQNVSILMHVMIWIVWNNKFLNWSLIKLLYIYNINYINLLCNQIESSNLKISCYQRRNDVRHNLRAVLMASSGLIQSCQGINFYTVSHHRRLKRTWDFPPQNYINLLRYQIKSSNLMSICYQGRNSGWSTITDLCLWHQVALTWSWGVG